MAGRATRVVAAEKNAQRSWVFLLVRNALLAVVPVALLWILLTPLYNRVLLESAQKLVRLTEYPSVTDLLRKDTHFAYIGRRDFPPARALVHSFRVTDVHFHLIMVGVLFLAIPRVSWRKRLENLGWAALITIFFDIFLIVFYVKATYAVQLGAWSLAHYGAFARNFYGLAKHLLDLPFKLSLPFLLWIVFYYRDLSAGIRTRD
ncbi:MAG TPA: hypothetical protein VLB76_21245 [Thermoanaerobaculia bacterium]|jgi:hypothetical protein|nr:hypothetical protein [Thermoanaerobaculia bacterium]